MVKPRPITIPTEPIGRIPRPVDLIERVKKADSEDRKLAPLHDAAVRDLTEHIEGASSPVLIDGEQRMHHNFGTYRVHGLAPYGSMIRLPTVRSHLGERLICN